MWEICETSVSRLSRAVEWKHKILNKTVYSTITKRWKSYQRLDQISRVTVFCTTSSKTSTATDNKSFTAAPVVYHFIFTQKLKKNVSPSPSYRSHRLCARRSYNRGISIAPDQNQVTTRADGCWRSIDLFIYWFFHWLIDLGTWAEYATNKRLVQAARSLELAGKPGYQPTDDFDDVINQSINQSI